MKAAQRAIPKIPDGMVELMKNLVKSVLKEQPENIYLFAAEYFENLVLKRDGSLDKEYSVFRRYEEELERRRDKEGCSRCRHLVNVEGNADDDLTKQSEVEHSLEMSVSGVAIKAVPRHYKPLKSQKSRQELETIRSESMDSAIDDDDKHDNKNPVEPTNEVNEKQIEPMEKIPTEKIVQPLIEEIIEPITARAMMNDEDVPPDTPTNDTSISDANTDRTVIEIAVSTLAIDNKNNDLNALESDTEENNSIDNKPINTSTEIQLLNESPKTELINLQKSDRIRTPESDSGLSEKSFNLNIHEETTANEMYKAEPIKEEDLMEEELIPVTASKSSEMAENDDKKMDDGKMNRSDIEQSECDINETEQIQTDDSKNENREERKDEIERVRSSKRQKKLIDQAPADSQEIITDDIFEKVKNPNNIVSKEKNLETTELTGNASSENNETNLKEKPLAESNVLEKKKIEKEHSSFGKSKINENDQSADSTEKPAIEIKIKADEQIPTQKETDTRSNELNLIEENEELPKTTANQINYVQTKIGSDNEKMIEFNGQKSIDAILEIETSEINEISSENVKVNGSIEGKPIEFEEMTESQPIIDEHDENSNEKAANNFDVVEMAESNEKESIVTESTLNDTESPNVIYGTKNIDILSGKESDKTKSIESSNSEDQVDTKWKTTKDSVAQKVQQQDGNQVELHMNQLTENQSPNQDLDKSDSDDLKVNQPSEQANIVNKAIDSLNGDDLVKNNKKINENQPMKEINANNEMNGPITELMSVNKENTEIAVVPSNLDSKETIISNELKNVEKGDDGIQRTDSPKKARNNESSLEASKYTQPESVPTMPQVQSNESELKIGEKPVKKLTTPKIEINELASEIGGKHSEDKLNSPPTTPETVEQLLSKSTPTSPKTEINRAEPILDRECEKHSNKTENNDQQKLSDEITILIENEPTNSNVTTIIEQNLQSTIIENNTKDIEMTHFDMKNNNDDAMSEMSSSVKDDLYEKAETEIFGDESVPDLDVLMQESEQTEDTSKENLTRPNTAKQQTNSQVLDKNDNRIQPDSLDDSLQPMGENDSLVSTKSVDSFEVKKEINKSNKNDVTTSSLELNEENSAHSQIDQDSVPNKSTKTDDKQKHQKEIAVTPTLLVESKPDSFSQDLMGDSVNDKGIYDHMNDQMKNELATSNSIHQNVTTIQLSNIEEVDTPVAPKPAENEIKFIYESEVNVQDDVKLDKLTKENKENAFIKIETIDYSEMESKESMSTKSDGEVILETQPGNPEKPNNINSDIKSQNNVKTVDFLTSLRHISHDTPSYSDLSDTDTEKPELVSNESCIDENSRDDHDDVSEVENFDLSSCGEDSLEAMYYMLRKNEILMDEQQKMNKCDDEKITFPEKATENLENAFHEVSGKKACSIGSRNNSSSDEVILKRISSDSDALQMCVLPNSEIDSSTEPRSYTMNTTDDEYLTEKNDTSAHGMVHNETESKIKQTDNSLTNDVQPANECDTFDDHVIQTNIERKIQVYSISEANSNEMPNNTRIFTMNDFNVSTALGHLRSTTKETLESAATKIQAVAKGFLIRRRLGRSDASASASASASNEKRSSNGNAAIVRSLDSFVDRQKAIQDQQIIKTESDDLRPVLSINQKIESIDDDASVRGIIEVKMEQRRKSSIVINENITEISTFIETELKEIGSDESGTTQRRLTLQRGDAMQRNSTPELGRQQPLNDTENIDNKEPTNEEAQTSPKQDEATTEIIHKPVKSASKLPTDKPMKTLGPRQRSMPVQFESMLMRVLPMPEQKRNKSANSSTPKKTKRKPNLF